MKSEYPEARFAENEVRPRGVDIRSARSADATPIVRLIRQGFRPGDLELFIYGCRGVGKFVSQEIIGAGTSRNPYSVASVAGRVIGCLDLRRSADGLFLNYIAVAPKARSLGIGEALLRSAAANAAVSSGCSLALDVFDDNTGALRWYLRLGFTGTECRYWYESVKMTEEARVAPKPRAFEVSGWPQAEASQKRFGFSRFVLVTSNGSHDIGRLGETHFRITSLAAFEDPDLWSCLDNIDARRRVLCILREPVNFGREEPGLRLVRRTRRLSAVVEHLIGGRP